MMDKVLEYFNGDELAASVWKDKYQLKDLQGNPMEETPDDMHRRMAKEFARIEKKYQEIEEKSPEKIPLLSDFGQELIKKRGKELSEIESSIYLLFKDFQYIVPQGSIMAMLGNTYKIGSLSNCFVVPNPVDSYGGILYTDQQLVQLMKRRGGVGTCLDNMRYDGATVTNAAGSSTGIISWANRFSNTTREVAQKGRRGALMLLLSVMHPDIFKFVRGKEDLTQITGANISVFLTDEFLKAVEDENDFLCKFPIDYEFTEEEGESGDLNEWWALGEYNKIWEFRPGIALMKVRAKELFDTIVEMAWKVAEPGVAFRDRVDNYSPEGVYPQYRSTASNPCFHPDTLVSTVNGQVKIKDITKPTMVYSMDRNGSLVIRKASASFITKRDANVLTIEVRSGSSITVTPDHKLYVHNKGWVKAKDLSLGDRIAHLARSRRGAAYSGIHLTTEGKVAQRMEHRFIYEGVNGRIKLGYDIHHKDGNTYNNNIDNLEEVDHDLHGRITAIEQNPQNHQIRNNSNGRFISGPRSRFGNKTIVNVPEDLKTNLVNHAGNKIIAIYESEPTDVYDIMVEETHCLIANNLVAHNCGEQWMSPYDACRLIATNLFSLVHKPFTKEAKIDEHTAYSLFYMQQRLADDVVDLEIEHIDRIINKILTDPEHTDIKMPELTLWRNIRDIASSGRRTGSGFTALGDMLAALGLKYDSDEAKSVIEKVMKIKMRAELDCTIDMAIMRGTFKEWDSKLEDWNKDAGNDFYKMLFIEFPDQYDRMMIYGRRNINWSTLAPTGTVSIMTQTVSGLEPLFLPFYMRRKKINPDTDPNVRVDFVDQNGDQWQQYNVIHPKLMEWIKAQEGFDIPDNNGITEYITGSEASYNVVYNTNMLQWIFELSPWFGSTANDIDWKSRVEIQGIIQKYTTNAISSTINLPKDIPQSTIGDIYLESWKAGLKGVTVYRDTSRSGVLVSHSETKKDEFGYVEAVKRPKELEADYYYISSRGKRFAVIVGLLNGNPYEVFAYENPSYQEDTKGKITKIRKGVYRFDSARVSISNLQLSAGESDERLLTRWVSLLLRHGANPKFVVEQTEKSEVNITSFARAIARILKKYIPNTTEDLGTECPSCHEHTLVYEEGCKSCKSCGYSAC